MKKNIHPQYNSNVEVQCICGNKFTVNATVEGPIKVENCPGCHTTYTGKEETKVIKGRREKFLAREEKVAKIKSSK